MQGSLINLTPGMRFGIGVDSLTQEVKAEALEFDSIEYRKGAEEEEVGQKVDPSYIKKIESQESLMEELNISIAASFRYGLASADAKMSFAEQHAVQEYSLYLLAKATVVNPPKKMVRPRLNARAIEILNEEGIARFQQIYGDSYIDEIYSGGEFFGLFVFRSRDEHSHSELSASLNMAFGALFAGGEINAGFKSTIEKAQRHSSMEIYVKMSGGKGLHNPQNLQELLELHHDFNTHALEAPIDYAAFIKNFQYLPLPKQELFPVQTARRYTIETCGRRIIENIKLKSKIEFILQNPDQFENPNLGDLKAKFKQAGDSIPRLAQRAEACAHSLEGCVSEEDDDIEMPVVVDWPKRLPISDPLEAKWQWVQENINHPYTSWVFSAEHRPPQDFKGEGPNGGRYWIFRKKEDGEALGGIFWHPDCGAHIVYGDIFQEYYKRNHCEGSLGYPTSDEETLFTVYGELFHELKKYKNTVDDTDRVSVFQHGILWWDSQTRQVSDQLPSQYSLVLEQTSRPIYFNK